jgi:hypothetical protein
MPRYYFDLFDHDRSPDETGTELADADEARREAVIFAGTCLRDNPTLAWDGQELRVIVRNEDDMVIFTVVMLSVDCLS